MFTKKESFGQKENTVSHNGDNNHCHDHHGRICSCSGGNEGEYIKVYTHDMSVVGSIRCRLEKTMDEAEELLDSCLREAAKKVNEAGGIIGHIKAYINEDGDSCMISLTEEESHRRYMKGKYVSIEGAAIVFGIAPEKLHSILEKVLLVLKTK